MRASTRGFDINGSEIFEGDTVEFDYYNGLYHTGFKGVVELIDFEFRVVAENKDDGIIPLIYGYVATKTKYIENEGVRVVERKSQVKIIKRGE